MPKVTPREPSHTSHTKKCKRTLKSIPTNQKHDKQWVNTRLIYQTLEWWKPISTHTNTPSTGSAATPKPTRPPQCPPRFPLKVSPNLPCTRTPNPAHQQENQNEGTLSLTIYKYLRCVQVVTWLTEGYLIYGYNLKQIPSNQWLKTEASSMTYFLIWVISNLECPFQIPGDVINNILI